MEKEEEEEVAVLVVHFECHLRLLMGWPERAILHAARGCGSGGGRCEHCEWGARLR